MLDEYKEHQSIVYNQLLNALKKNIAHAYLFNVNDNIYSEKIIMAFVKSIICPSNNTGNIDCSNCSICNRIDNGDYSEVKKIIPDGLWIKKEQLSDLQVEFRTKPIEGKKRIYIIYEVEKLNKQAANSILKFLEEPSDDIIAILITNNINLVMDTIVSRCQVITFNRNNINDYLRNNNSTLEKITFILKNSLNGTPNEQIYVESAINFIKKYEFSGIKMINNNKKFFHDIFKKKEEIEYAFDIMILIYKDALQYKINSNSKIFNDYINDIIEISERNSKIKLINKLNKVVELKELVKTNANSNLLMDKLIIELEGGNVNV